jgi:molecular chaperone GrpE (heat shock protein)
VLTEVSELKPASAITEDRFQEFSESVTKSLENAINRGDLDVVDYSSAEFNINYHNTIEIENIDVNTDSIVDELATILQDQFVGYFGELKQE